MSGIYNHYAARTRIMIPKRRETYRQLGFVRRELDTPNQLRRTLILLCKLR